MPPLLSPLTDPVFRRLFLARILALVGTGLATIALALLAHDLAGEEAGLVLGTALALKMVAYVGLAPFADSLSRLIPRRRLMVGLDGIRAVAVLCLPFVDSLWQIYVLILILNGASALFTPCFQALLPDVLPDEERYTNALSLSRLAYELESLLSPALAFLALMVMGYDALFLANALGFLASALLIGVLVLPPAPPSDRPHRLGEALGFGLRAYLLTPRLRALLALHAAVAFSLAMALVNSVVYVHERLGGSDQDLGLALLPLGAGAILGALLLPRLLRRSDGDERPWMLAGGGLSGLAVLAGLGAPGWIGFGAMWLLLGFGTSLIQTPAGRLLRRSCRAGDRSAYFAANFTLSHLCWLAAYPLAGWLSSHGGLESAFAVLGLVSLAATAVAGRLWPRPDPLVLEHEHPELWHVHPHRHGSDDPHHAHAHTHAATAPHGASPGPAAAAPAPLSQPQSQAHAHAHYHPPGRHAHVFVIDHHHRHWPRHRAQQQEP